MCSSDLFMGMYVFPSLRVSFTHLLFKGSAMFSSLAHRWAMLAREISSSNFHMNNIPQRPIGRVWNIHPHLHIVSDVKRIRSSDGLWTSCKIEYGRNPGFVYPFMGTYVFPSPRVSFTHLLSKGSAMFGSLAHRQATLAREISSSNFCTNNIPQ